jgi:hypothetical protein
LRCSISKPGIIIYQSVQQQRKKTKAYLGAIQRDLPIIQQGLELLGNKIHPVHVIHSANHQDAHVVRVGHQRPKILVAELERVDHLFR